MGNYPCFLRLLLIAIFLSLGIMSPGCQRKQNISVNDETGPQQIEHFKLTQVSEKMYLELTGEGAELTGQQKSAVINQPELSLRSSETMIEVTTGGEGKAEVRLNPQRQEIEEAILEGKVKLVQKDASGKKVLMQASCQKLSYHQQNRVMIMEGNPVVTREANSFSGEKIYYYWTENRIEIKGNVRVLVYPEKDRNP
ncbi:MAG: LPS export ABC transporter periplasmic protein LptC [Candidatus Omnitrophica bacterium]|nr:LPS export ABC transporter periplasmic protein LptC [Candidatus Omnitrophota bacterium]MCM8769576.1 LPS export ABC transporter periplasmic protein LptC [Candidatus Omnitrophota bacterium]